MIRALPFSALAAIAWLGAGALLAQEAPRLTGRRRRSPREAPRAAHAAAGDRATSDASATITDQPPLIPACAIEGYALGIQIHNSP